MVSKLNKLKNAFANPPNPGSATEFQNSRESGTFASTNRIVKCMPYKSDIIKCVLGE